MDEDSESAVQEQLLADQDDDSSDDDNWWDRSWVGKIDADMDTDSNMNDLIDLKAAVREAEKKYRSECKTRRPVQSLMMPKAETPSIPIQLTGGTNKTRRLRIWDVHDPRLVRSSHQVPFTQSCIRCF